jgi:hypothetical protein
MAGGQTPGHSTAPQKSVAAQKEASPAIGEPMAPQELGYVRNTLSSLLDASQNDPKKREHIAKSLEDLYSKLQSGMIKPTAAAKVLELVRKVEGQDYAGAQRIQQELCHQDWDMNKGWLMGVKRLIPMR